MQGRPGTERRLERRGVDAGGRSGMRIDTWRAAADAGRPGTERPERSGGNAGEGDAGHGAAEQRDGAVAGAWRGGVQIVGKGRKAAGCS